MQAAIPAAHSRSPHSAQRPVCSPPWDANRRQQALMAFLAVTNGARRLPSGKRLLV